MANTVKIKQSSVQGKIPTISPVEQIVLGELAINTHDGKVYLRQNDTASGGSDRVILVNPFTEDEATAAKEFTVARVLDTLTFDSATTLFGLSYDGGTALTYGDINLDEVGRLLIVVGGQIQGEGNGFNIGTGTATDQVQITFTEAPETGLAFFGTVQARQGNTSPGISEERAIAYSIALGGN
jgi:hypothetical protein